MSIEVQRIVKTFGSFTALNGVNFRIAPGELVALLGPSGSGKTTLLRIIAGLEIPDSGTVLFDGLDVSSRKVKERQVGFVFQHYALFRHMTVFDNVAFGLNVRPRRVRPSQEAIKLKVFELLKLVRLEGMALRYPSQLSGGQRQRVALARALAIEPKMLLLDEPFGSLDAKVRKELRQWIRELHDKLHMTSVFVTHDQEEALEVADRIVVMNEGKIEQIGTPDEVYHHPASPFVSHFLGSVNLFHCRLEGGKILFGNAPADSGKTEGKQEARNATVYIRPHLLDIEYSAPANGNYFRAKVKSINAAGPLVRVELTTEWDALVQVEISHERYQYLGLKKDAAVFAIPKEVKVFTEDYSI